MQSICNNSPGKITPAQHSTTGPGRPHHLLLTRNVFQAADRQVEKHGSKAAWYVGWVDPNGTRKQKKCGSGTRGRKLAERMADQIHSQLITGTYESEERKSWADFRAKYDEQILAGMGSNSRTTAMRSLANFERVAKPRLVKSITTEAVDKFVAKRRKEPGARKGTKTSPATINRDLRYLRAALRKARAWKFISDVPEFTFLREQTKIPTYVPPAHFAAIYEACENASRPSDLPNLNPADWWRAIVVTAFMTGWRISQIMSLRWEDVDFENGTALSRADDNKGKRDVMLPLHPAIVEHLSKLTGTFDKYVFPWNHRYRGLWEEFANIQKQATLADGSPLPKGGKNGGRYGFHDLRRGFATANAESMDLFELQALMQHKSLETTKLYVGMSKKLKNAVSGLQVPDILQNPATG